MTAGRLRGWRGLGAFWAAVLFVVGGLATTLEVLGPPRATVTETIAPPPVRETAPEPKPGEIAAPVASMLEPSKAFPGSMLPKLGPAGQASRVMYARAATAAAGRPRIALLLIGLGPSANDSRAAMETLPGPISVAFSPYAGNTEPLQLLARRSGHEMLISIPMESLGFPLNDAGSHSLLTGAPPAQNATNLDWSLSRIQGYVGAVGALESMRGERFADQTSSWKVVLDELKRRGLLYVDPRPGKPSDLLAPVPGRAVDLIVDDPPARAEIEAKLAGLERIAREKGSALGLAGPLRPVTIERIAAWASGLGDRGIDLAPVSALVGNAEPPKPEH